MPVPMKRHFQWIALVLILLLGVLLRLNLSVKAFFSTFDNSTVGLMALHILEGERPLFYYGQNYMGALEAYVAAGMFILFGVSTTSLSLTAILFATGWIAAMYFLFSELLDFRAGLAAALCTAAGGWYTMWFSMATYGGYANTFFFGTVFLTLAVRMASRDLSGFARWTHAGAMGLTAAFGVWTNFQVFSYLVTGGLVLLAAMVPKPSRRLLIRPVLAATALSLTGFLPLLITFGGLPVGPGDWGGLSLVAVPDHAGILFERLSMLFIWPVETSRLLLKVSLATWLMAAFLYAVKLLTMEDRVKRLKTMITLLFAVVFLSLYLVHPLAAKGAPRYLVPLITMITAAFFGGAVSHRWKAVRWSGYVLLTIWALFNTASVLQTAEVKEKLKGEVVALRMSIIRQAEEAGLRHLMILGSDIDGHRGQSMTFYARDRVRFVSSSYERYYPAVESAELDPRPGFFFNGTHLDKVRRSLAAAGVRSYKVRNHGWSILYDVEVPRERLLSVPGDKMTLETDGIAGEGIFLLDRNAATRIEEPAQENSPVTLEVRLDRVRSIVGLWVTARDSMNLPSSFTVSTSLDGKTYRPGKEFRDILPTYTAGNRIYMMGFLSRIELRFEPVEARFIRIEVRQREKFPRPWEINEIFLFEGGGAAAPVTEEEVDRIAEKLLADGTDFVAADRWLSARLATRMDQGTGNPVAFPVPDPRHPRTVMRRILAPRVGLAVAVEKSVAEEGQRVLEERLSPGASLVRDDFPHYTLFCFQGPPAAFEGTAETLEWNGHYILGTTVQDGD